MKKKKKKKKIIIITADTEDAEPLYTEKIFSDRKVFFIDLKANDRGKFLKITEDVRGRRDTIMVPEESLQELIDALNNVSEYLKNEGDQD